jgi:transcriptional regulator with XRE-family HTH domain
MANQTAFPDEEVRVSRNLAANIEALRKKRQLTQSQLAKLAGLPRSTLTYLESGLGNPSLQNLVKISAALQISLEELLAAPRGRYKLIKADEIQATRRGGSGAQSVRVFDLLPDPIPGMHIDRMELDVGTRMGGVPHLSGTKEYMTCLQGEVTVKVAGGSFVVGRGDVFAFPGDQPHSYQNTGPARAICISVVVIAPMGS